MASRSPCRTLRPGLEVVGLRAAGKVKWGGAKGTERRNKGVLRLQKHGPQWQEASLDKAILQHAGPKATSWITKTGKKIWENPTTGRQIIVDPAGYFRIFHPKAFGSSKGTYLDMMGKVPAPAKFLKGGKMGNIALTGEDLNRATHFIIK